mmetsp:Transcript_68768/g.222175  ORF Transcript_68768/g.222175 Transcript_68768/m.222175 type:complete len:287 (+) Transcript_68768:306-1166(+)
MQLPDAEEGQTHQRGEGVGEEGGQAARRLRVEAAEAPARARAPGLPLQRHRGRRVPLGREPAYLQHPQLHPYPCGHHLRRGGLLAAQAPGRPGRAPGQAAPGRLPRAGGGGPGPAAQGRGARGPNRHALRQVRGPARCARARVRRHLRALHDALQAGRVGGAAAGEHAPGRHGALPAPGQRPRRGVLARGRAGPPPLRALRPGGRLHGLQGLLEAPGPAAPARPAAGLGLRGPEGRGVARLPREPAAHPGVPGGHDDLRPRAADGQRQLPPEGRPGVPRTTSSSPG